MSWPVWLMVLAGGLTACGDDDATPGDAAVDAGADSAPGDGSADAMTDAFVLPAIAAPAPPAPPAPPQLLPCPPGWREVRVPDLAPHCAPYPAAAPLTCAADEAHFPGEPACSPVGTPCPAGDYATDLPVGASILYVKRGATGGNGSLATPFGSIFPATSAASPGTVIALDKSTFPDLVALPPGVTLWGACPGLTQVASVSASGAGARRFVRNLSISGNAAGLNLTGADVDVDGVIVRAALITGVFVDGGSLSARALVVRDTRPDTTLGYGIALRTRNGAAVDLTRASLERSTTYTIAAESGSRVTLRDTVLLDSRQFTNTGFALRATGGASADLERVAVIGCERLGVLVVDGMLRLRDVNLAGCALGVRASPLDAERCVIEDAMFNLSETTGSLRDTVVLGPGSTGVGVYTHMGGALSLDRVEIVRVRGVGLQVSHPGSTLVANDVNIHDTLPNPGFIAPGLHVAESAQLSARRLAIARTPQALTLSVGTSSTLEDVTITDSDGAGILSIGGAAILNRLVISRVRGAGLLLHVPAGNPQIRVVASDVKVSRVSPTPGNVTGAGLDLSSDVDFVGSRVVLQETTLVALRAQVRARARVTDLVVDDVRAPACTGPSCLAYRGFATGLGSYGEALLDVTRFRITRSALCGLQIARDGAIDLREGSITDNVIGANVQDRTFELRRIVDRVIYRNGVNLDTTQLPLPPPPMVP